MSREHDNARFATTRWTLLAQANSDNEPAARAALERLCQLYWSPLYTFLRRYGKNEHDARDSLQSFFAVLLERKDLQSVDAAKGKFRNYLLASLKNFLANEAKYLNAVKRSGNVMTRSIDWQNAEQAYSIEPQDNRTPECIYEYQWALTSIQSVMEQLKQEMHDPGRPAYFSELAPFLSSTPPSGYAEIASRHGVSTSAMKNAVSANAACVSKIYCFPGSLKPYPIRPKSKMR